nr:transporter substrate-binding domain-containing protein [Microbulbifer pacificus]
MALILVLVANLVLTRASYANEPTHKHIDSSSDAIGETKKLRVGIPAINWPPLQITHGVDSYTGASIDIVEIFAGQLGRKAEFFLIQNDEDMKKKLDSGEIDLAVRIQNSEEAVNKVEGYIYAAVSPAFLARHEFRNLSELKKVAFLKGQYTKFQLERLYPHIDFIEVSSLMRGFYWVKSGALDALLSDETYSKYTIKQTRWKDGRLLQAEKLPIKRLRLLTKDSRLESEIERISQSERYISDANTVLARWNIYNSRINLSNEEHQWILNNPIVRVGAPRSIAPYGQISKQGEYEGIDNDILNIVRRETGLEFEYVEESDWGKGIEKLKLGKIDLLGASIPHKRDSDIIFGIPYSLGIPVILAKSGSPLKDSASSLRNPRIATSKTISELVHEDLPNAQFVYSKNWEKGFELLIRNQVDALVMLEPSANYYLNSSKDNDIQIVGAVGATPVHVSFSTTKNKRILLSILDKVISNLSEFELERLAFAWEPQTTEDRISRRTFIIVQAIAAVSIALLAASFFWLRYLNSQIERRKAAEKKLEFQIEREESANKKKSIFLATMSHEIRTRVSAITGIIELLLNRASTTSGDYNMLSIAHASSTDLVDLIGDVIDINKIDQKKLSLNESPHRIEDILNPVLNSFAVSAASKSLKYEVHKSQLQIENFLVDSVRLKQILSNILSNSVKYTNSGSIDIYIDYHSIETPKNVLELSIIVEDTGVGIPHEFLGSESSILDSSYSMAPNSSGLGLAITNELCKLMKGRLHIERIGKNGGTRAKIDIPLTPYINEHPEEKFTRCKFRNSLPNKRQDELSILIVDDHPTNRMILREQLSTLGHSVSAANSGAEAVQNWVRGKFDLVITDCNMPSGDGYFLAAQMREIEDLLGLNNCHIIGYTANALSDEEGRCLSSGMNQVIFKPISIDDLNSSITVSRLTKYPIQAIEDSANAAHIDLQFDAFMKNEKLAEIFGQLIETNAADINAIILEASSGKLPMVQTPSLLHRIRGPAQIFGNTPLVNACLDFQKVCENRHSKHHELQKSIARLLVEITAMELNLKLTLPPASSSQHNEISSF